MVAGIKHQQELKSQNIDTTLTSEETMNETDLWTWKGSDIGKQTRRYICQPFSMKHIMTMIIELPNRHI